jgi:hypothetical protein
MHNELFFWKKTITLKKEKGEDFIGGHCIFFHFSLV